MAGTAARSLSLATSLSAALLASAAWPRLAEAADDDPPVAAQATEITEKARGHFRAGVSLLQDPDGARYEEAYHQFKIAYAESPSWKILGNLGFTAMKLERDGEAIEAFRGYLEQGGGQLSDAERAQFQRDLNTLSTAAATITFPGLPAGARVTDARVPNSGPDVTNRYQVPDGTPLVLRVRSGMHRFQVEWDGQRAQTRELQANPGGAHEVIFETPQPEPEPREPLTAPEPTPPPAASASPRDAGFFQSPLPVYVSFGVGAVGVGLGALFLTQRASATSDADSRFDACLASQACAPSDQSDMQDLDEKAARMGTLSALSFGVGAVGLGAGVALLLLNGNASEAAMPAAAVTFQPYASANEVGLWGQF